MAGGFRDKSLEEIKEDVARMNNPIQYEIEKKDAEKLKKQVEQRIEHDRSVSAKHKSELTEREILLRILEKLESIDKQLNVEAVFQRQLRRHLGIPNIASPSQHDLYID